MLLLSLPVLHYEIVSRKLFENSFAFKMQKYVPSFEWLSVHLSSMQEVLGLIVGASNSTI